MRRADVTVPMMIILVMILASQDAFGRTRKWVSGKLLRNADNEADAVEGPRSDEEPIGGTA
jgi:hypothetical protein